MIGGTVSRSEGVEAEEEISEGLWAKTSTTKTSAMRATNVLLSCDILMITVASATQTSSSQ